MNIENKYRIIINKLLLGIYDTRLTGWDPYDVLNCHFIQDKFSSQRALIIFTQLNRISPLNLRPILGIRRKHNSKAMALILAALLNIESNQRHDIKNRVKTWLLENRSQAYPEYSLGFTFDIVLKQYKSSKGSPSLIITLFAIYALINYWEKTGDEEVLKAVLSFNRLIQDKLPHFEEPSTLWYSYNFEKINEIYNATAKIGKFYALLFNITNDQQLPVKIEKILNYLVDKQRNDGSWAYGENIGYTDGFHTAFVLEAIWYMRKAVDSLRYERMFNKGLAHYKKYLFKPNVQPLYFHPKYKPKDIRRYLIETDIRDCAMAIILFSKIGEKVLAKKVLDWTLKNMYNHKKGYFYYYKNRLWTNKIEFIRWQAWMLSALSVYNQNFKNFTFTI